MQPSAKAARRQGKRVVLGAIGSAVMATSLVAYSGISSAQFLPHLYCYLGNARLIWLHVTSDLLIGISYLAISSTLAYLVWKTRRSIPFSWIFIAFGTFIIACGFTHFMEVIVIWKPVYWASGAVKALTAAASAITAILLPAILPKIRKLVDTAQGSEQGFKALLQSAPDAMVVVNKTGTIVLVNSQTEQLFGYKEEELVGQRVEILIPKRFTERHPGQRTSFFSDPRVRSMGQGLELFAQRKDGSEFPVEISLSPFRRDGEPLVISAIRDISFRRRAEEKFRGLMESAPDAMIIVDYQGKIALANSQTEDLFGYRRVDLIGKPVEILLPARFREHHHKHRTSFWSDPKIRPMGAGLELFGLKANGQEFPVEISLSPLNTEEGAFVTAAIRDITDRKKIESDLAKRTETLEEQAALLDLAHNSIFVRDLENKIQFWNRGAEERYGWRREEAVGQVVHTLLQTQFRMPLAEIEGQLRQTGHWEGELVHRKRSGEEILVSSRWALQTDQKGVPRGILEINDDITERKRIEEAALKLAAIVEYSDDAIISKDLNGTIVSWNSGAERMFGYTPDEAIGRNLSLIYPPERVSEAQEVLSHLRASEPVEHLETVRITKSGHKIDVLVTISPIRDVSGKLVGASKIVRDISSRKQAERQVQSLNAELKNRVEELAASNQELESFTYSVSHDLRAPLRHIDGFSKILVEDHSAEFTDESREYLRLICDSTREMGQLVDDLLALAHLGRKDPDLQLTGLDAIVNGIISDLKRANAKRLIDWKVGRLPFVECDPGLMKQVFTNLLSNAVKYTRPRSPATIEVGVSNENGTRAIFVRDNGVGFNMKHAQKLFGVFQRLHRQEDFEGTGVGLATVQRIVHKHRGRIWADARVNDGATFYFTLGTSEGPELEPDTPDEVKNE